MQERDYFLTGNITKAILYNAIPALGGIILISIDSFLDGLLVTRMIGPGALAGLTLITPLLIFQTALGSLAASGVAILISKAIGENNKKRVSDIFFNLHIVALILAVLAHLLWLLSGNYMLHLLSFNETEIRFAGSFYTVFSSGSLIPVLAFSYGAVMRSSGQFKRATIHLFISIITSVLFSLILIPSYGMQGAAYAVLISMLVYGLLNLLQIVRFLKCKGNFNGRIIGEIFSIGFSSFLFQLSSILRQLIIIKFINVQQGSNIALYGAVSRMIALAIIPVQAIVQSFQPLYIANLSANRQDRYKKAISITRKYSLLFSCVIFILAFLFSDRLIAFFMNTRSVSSDSLMVFRMCFLLILFYPISAVSYVLLQSSGFHRYSSVIASLREVVLLLPLMLLFNYFLLHNAVYWAILTEVIFYTTGIYLLYRYKMAGYYETLNNQDGL